MSWVGSAFGKEEPLSFWTLDCVHGVGELLVDTPKSLLHLILAAEGCSGNRLLLSQVLTPSSQLVQQTREMERQAWIWRVGWGFPEEDGAGELGAFRAEDGWG